MPKRKNNLSGSGSVVKTHFVPTDFAASPVCPHGPQITFEKNGKRFHTCSAFRCRKECEQNSSKIQWKQSNSGLAQYIFTPECTQFFERVIRDLKLRNVLCLGVPSLHETLLLNSDIRSLLLDMDSDMVAKFPETAVHYNMCNHYFFGVPYRDRYLEFLRKSEDLTVFMDPPFSAKPELLSHVHGLIEQDFRSQNLKEGSLSVFWIAPYFLEGHLKKSNPLLAMSDYQVNYSDHVSFSRGKRRSRKHGSPIRLFTTVSLSLIKLPPEDYKFCKSCEKFVAKSNKHCKSCGTCTSKDGQTYHHCDICKKCVKPSWSHCSRCNQCSLTAEHQC